MSKIPIILSYIAFAACTLLCCVGVVATSVYFFGDPWEFCRFKDSTLTCSASSEKDRKIIDSLIEPPVLGKVICVDGRISIQGISFNDGKVLDAVVTSAQKACTAERGPR